MGCGSDTPKNDKKTDEVKDFMETVFGEDGDMTFDCSALIERADFSDLCISSERQYKIKKDVENPLICIYMLKSKYSTVDIAINTSPMSMITGQVFKAAKSDAKKKGKVQSVRRLGKNAFYHESTYKAGDYSIRNRDLSFYDGKTMFTLHTVSGKNKNENCMHDLDELKGLAKSLLKSLNTK